MPVQIVHEGVVTRSVRDTAAFVRESERVYRNLKLPPVGDVTHSGRHRVRVALVTNSIGGRMTDDETTQTVMDMSRALGKTPVEVNDFPGFVANRVLMPMINEAIFALGEGVATMRDIDTACRLGLNHPMGPITLADFIGLDTCLEIIRVLHSGTGDPKFRPAPLLVKYVEAGWTGKKSGRGFYDWTGAEPVPTRS
jgi:3-hydroxybutyryl-CoA dehydrogenase